MRILTSNDDGVFALGNKILRTTLMTKFETITIAPDRERSSCGHSITLDQAIRLRKIKENIYSCNGKPADCVLIGIGEVMRSSPPNIVISGINHGANLGQDRYYSGTIAAAREACLRGIPAIAVSLCSKKSDEVFYFEDVAKYILSLLEKGIVDHIPEQCVLNINYPNIASEKINGAKYTTLGRQIYTDEAIKRVDARGQSYYWLGGQYQGHEKIKDSDANAVDEGFISLTLQETRGSICETHTLQKYLNG